jgi:hypothetical protein
MEIKESVNHARENGGAHSDKASAAEAVRDIDRVEVQEALEDVVSSIEGLYQAADTFLGHHARERPHVVLGAAAGIGFVLGGGLASRVGGFMLTVGGRLLMNRLLEGASQG